MQVWRTEPPGRRRGGHWYETDHENHAGSVLPSVTAITGILDKPALIAAAVKLDVEAMAGVIRNDPYGLVYKVLGTEDDGDHDEWLDPIVKAAKGYHSYLWGEAAKEGTEAHQVVSEYLTGTSHTNLSVTDSIMSVFPSLVMWWEATQPEKILAVEELVAHPDLDYAGTVDLIYLGKDGVVHIADWKTGNIGYDEQAAQLAGYALAWMAMTNHPWEIQCEVVHLNKSGEPGFEVKEVNMSNAVELFLGALATWKASQRKLWR